MTLKNYTINIKTKLYKVVEISGHNIPEAIENLNDFIKNDDTFAEEILNSYDKKRYQYQVLDIEKIEETDEKNECDSCEYSCPNCKICIYPHSRG